MSYAVFAPEINSALIFSGPGSTPMSAAWAEVSEELTSAANAFAAITADLSTTAWQGPAASAMTAAAAPDAG